MLGLKWAYHITNLTESCYQVISSQPWFRILIVPKTLQSSLMEFDVHCKHSILTIRTGIGSEHHRVSDRVFWTGQQATAEQRVNSTTWLTRKRNICWIIRSFDKLIFDKRSFTKEQSAGCLLNLPQTKNVSFLIVYWPIWSSSTSILSKKPNIAITIGKRTKHIYDL